MYNIISLNFGTIIYIELSMSKQALSFYVIIPTQKGYIYLFNWYMYYIPDNTYIFS